jgi:hypothetical protein
MRLWWSKLQALLQLLGVSLAYGVKEHAELKSTYLFVLLAGRVSCNKLLFFLMKCLPRISF